jgi:2-polyprenyl-6-methoxyphenol hydroxylase-like FAD-dependent oxidoreductase
MPDAPDFYFDSVSQIRMDRWCSGRTALLGDAAHCASPLSGMGSGLAVVGAYVLAGELAAAGNDHRAAFARYEARMRDYVTRCQKSALPAGRWFVPRSRPQIWLRNQNFRMLVHMPWKGLIAGVSRKTANAIVLADYRVAGPASPIQ